MTKIRLIFSLYLLSIVALFLYSFTQIDLSLTFSKASIFQVIQKQFQYIGFFQRPLSAAIFLTIVISLFTSYLSILYLAVKNKISAKNILILTVATFVILVFSYNAFSYDFFNYIFDAKILTFYGQNPYLFKPSDFSQDPMLNFMRWVHRVYPYGPSWLILTVPLSYLGMSKFIVTFFIFKILIGLSYVGSAFLIYKISEIIFPKNKIINTAFWAFNPLVIIESLVSAHNDLPMIFFALFSIFLFIKNKKILSFLTLSFSIGIKFLTATLMPVFLYIWYLQKNNKKINWENIFLIAFLFSIAGLIYATLRTTFQPWYLLFIFTLGAFLSKKYFIFIPVLLTSIFSLLIYLNYVYMTDYAKEYPLIISNIQLLGFWVTIFAVLGYYLKIKFFK